MRELWTASKGRRRAVALYRSYGDDQPLAVGPLRSMGLCAARVGKGRVPWSDVGRVESWPDARCQNCLREHAAIDACFVGVLAGVLVDRGTFQATPELLARVHVDEMWDLYGGPAADWLEEHLSWLEANEREARHEGCRPAQTPEGSPVVTAEDALDQIAARINEPGETQGPDFLEFVSQLLPRTGREVVDSDV
ncbi:MAG TPA: hypothetical protein VF245_00925 [Solirubrobacterales bacterium]